MRGKEVRELSIVELEKKLRDTREDLLRLRMSKQMGQVENPTLLRVMRRDIARCETILREKKSAAASA